MNTGIQLIAEERQEQIENNLYDNVWNDRHPGCHESKEMAFVANMLIASEWEEGIDPQIYPLGWEEDCENMLSEPYKQRLIIAGALIAAELDRLNSKTNPND